MIAIIDYGMGNLSSVLNAFEAIGDKVKIIKKPSELSDCDGIVLPGVGAFSTAMGNLKKAGFLDKLKEEVILKKKPYLGICLGLQLLAEKSYEGGVHKGFGWIKGYVKRLEPSDSSFKIPHMGWNNVKIKKQGGILKGLEDKEPVFYFVHSYGIFPKEDVISSTCMHGQEVIASIQKGNIFGVQFHPEKSQMAGLSLLKNFSDIVNKKNH